jgi:FOG: Ankyrin repeat
MDIIETAQTGNIARVRELIDATPKAALLALVNQKDSVGFTPLHWATWNRHPEIVRILIDAVPEDARLALLNQQDIIGSTTLHMAAFNSHIEIVRILLDAVPETARLDLVNKQNNSGETTLHYAARYGHAEITRMLIANGANLDAQNNLGYTPAQVASDCRYPEVANLIEDAQQHIANVHQQAQITALALAQAFHTRLGPDSPVQFMDQNLLRSVIALVVQANEQEARHPEPEPEQAPRWCVVS